MGLNTERMDLRMVGIISHELEEGRIWATVLRRHWKVIGENSDSRTGQLDGAGGNTVVVKCDLRPSILPTKKDRKFSQSVESEAGMAGREGFTRCLIVLNRNLGLFLLLLIKSEK